MPAVGARARRECEAAEKPDRFSQNVRASAQPATRAPLCCLFTGASLKYLTLFPITPITESSGQASDRRCFNHFMSRGAAVGRHRVRQYRHDHIIAGGQRIDASRRQTRRTVEQDEVESIGNLRRMDDRSKSIPDIVRQSASIAIDDKLPSPDRRAYRPTPRLRSVSQEQLSRAGSPFESSPGRRSRILERLVNQVSRDKQFVQFLTG